MGDRGRREGQQLGNYRLIRLLGQGNFADVYLGEHVHLGTQAAMKVLHEQLAGHDVEGFLKEARTIARLRHPHIVQVLDFGVEDAIPFLVMDYAPNGSLRQRHSKGTRLPLDTVVVYVSQVAEALYYAHQQRLIHRDIKPENMLLGRNNEVLLSDFGLAIVDQSSRQQQDTAGTIAYMAPEQLQGKPRSASDQYALGVVVYEWLCGDRPFHGTFAELYSQHLFVPPPLLHEKVPTIPSTVEHVVLKALTKDPQDRFASVRAFAEALEEICKTESSARTLLVPTSNRPPEYPGETKKPTNQLTMRSHNLPAAMMPLIGREQEVMAVCRLLQRPEVRLVTLTGPGGVGKTRLAVQVSSDLLDAFANGVCFIPLASINDPELVVSAIAHGLGLTETGGRPLLSLLKSSLQDKRLLLLLDNFEQVVAAAPRLSDLLTACPHLKMLVTSRAVLHIQGEREFPVPPLALPDLTHLPESEALSQYGAIVLFLQCAQAVKADFQITATNARTIAEICVRMDGLPLAIELAAARIKLLPLQALLMRLEHRLQILTSGARDAPARQQTLRNTLAWSYELLDAEEQRLFRRLSVFVGGSTLRSVEAMYNALGDLSTDVLNTVDSLIDKSLLQQTELEGEEPCLVMLETIREYGREALTASGEEEIVQQAHAGYYLALVEEAEPELVGPQQASWLERLAREHDNLRAALRWTIERGEAGQGMEMALRLAGALRRFWLIRGHISEGRNYLERAVEGRQGVAVAVRAKALVTAANLAFIQSDYERTETFCEESLPLFRSLGNRSGIALSLYLLGSVAWTRGRTAAARSLTEEALALSRVIGDKERIAWSLFNLGLLASSQGQYSRARSLFEESLATHKALGNKRGIAHTLSQLAQVRFVAQDDQTKVRSLLEECLTLSREVGFKEGVAASYCLLGLLALSQGDLPMARSLGEESVTLYKEMGHRHGTAEALAAFGKVMAAQGDYAAARSLYEESLAISSGLGEQWVIAVSLLGLGKVVAAQGEPAWAAQLWGAAEALRETLQVPIRPVERAGYEQAVDEARAQLGEKNFAARWTQGRTMTLEQALAAQGQGVVPGSMTTPTPSTAHPAGLTAREVEVLRLVARGLTDLQIAEQLTLSPRTVHAHISSIYGKLGVSSRSMATRYAIEHNLA